jgi:endonuclease YncB( thermonuclease family)
MAAAAVFAFEPDAAAAARRSTPAQPKCPLVGAKVASFSKLIGAGNFVTGDGTEVKLAGVLFPGAGGESVRQDQVAGARNVLSDALHGGSITLEPAAAGDRYGRMVAQAFAGEVWIQGALLRGGFARAAPDSASSDCAAALLAAENEAREKRAGLWADGVFAVRSPTDLNNRIGTFQIVEGRVVTATLIKGRAYLNFGPDYRTDFTATIAPTEMRLFRRLKIDPRELTGRIVRVRGWLGSYNGPEMDLLSPSALEVVN